MIPLIKQWYRGLPCVTEPLVKSSKVKEWYALSLCKTARLYVTEEDVNIFSLKKSTPSVIK